MQLAGHEALREIRDIVQGSNVSHTSIVISFRDQMSVTPVQ